MKLFLVLIIFSLTSMANASHLLEKYSWFGENENETSAYERCRVFSTYMSKVVQDGNGLKKYKYPMAVSASKIKALIRKAQTEKLSSKPNNVCDLPSTEMNAYKNGKRIRLYDTGGCSNRYYNRSGPASQALKAIVSKYCPETMKPETAQKEITHTKWNYIDATWDIGPDECYERTGRVYANGKFWKNACGKITRGKATPEQMKSLKASMAKVMTNYHKKVKCDGGHIQDYGWNYRVRAPGLKPKAMTYVKADGLVCYRGPNFEIGEEMTVYEQFDIIMADIALGDEK